MPEEELNPQEKNKVTWLHISIEMGEKQPIIKPINSDIYSMAEECIWCCDSY